MSVEASAPAVEKPVARRRLDRIWEAILTQRIVLLDGADRHRRRRG